MLADPINCVGGRREKNGEKTLRQPFSSLLTLSLITGIYTVKRLIFNLDKNKKKGNGFYLSGFFFEETRQRPTILLFKRINIKTLYSRMLILR